MKRLVLKVTVREATGSKVKKLRKQGILPANIYGPKTKSIAVQVPYLDFVEIYKQVGETGLIDLEFEGTKKPVLIHDVQLGYIDQKPLHADFFQVNMKEKVATMVPVVIIGEAKAVVDNLGLLLQTLNDVEVEALPADLPENIKVDVTELAEINDQITVEELKAPEGVTILSEPSTTVVKIGELVVEEPEPVAEEAPAVEGEEGETEEGEEKETTEETAKEETESEKESEEE